MKLFHTTLMAAAAAMMIAGCSKQNAQSDEVAQNKNQTTVQQAANDIKQSADKVAAGIDDSTITAKVKAALVAEPDLSALHINVDTADGVVTLTGSTDAPQKIKHAEQVAQTVNGVKKINNELVVQTPG